MFSKTSRYRKLPDVITLDAKGRRLAVKELRLLPQVTAVFRHTVKAGERLDQLAYQYYKQPRKWWLICDANPQFLSPVALLGQEVIVSARFPVTVTHGGDPPWADLCQRLRALIGVEDVRIEETVEQTPQQQTVGSRKVTVWIEHYQRAVLVTYNQFSVDIPSLVSAMVAAGFDPRQPTVISQLGQPIVIPPNGIG